MSLLEKFVLERKIEFSDLKTGDAVWLGRSPKEKRVRVQIEWRNPDGSFSVFFLNNSGLYGDLVQEPEEGAIFLRSPAGELSKPLYIVEKQEC